jgi:hypothetical protein
MLGNGHVRFGGRAGEAGRAQARHRVPVRPITYLRTGEGWLYLAAAPSDCQWECGWRLLEAQARERSRLASAALRPRRPCGDGSIIGVVSRRPARVRSRSHRGSRPVASFRYA